jgi:hypothetical protein
MSYSGVIKHLDNVNIGAAWKEIPVPFKSCERISLVNTHATQDMFLSFDGGSHQITLKRLGGSFNEYVNIDRFWLKGSGADTTWEGYVVV